MLKFFKESREELKKVVWPGKDEILRSTIVVLIATIVISIFLYMTDSFFEAVFQSLVRVGSGW